MNNNLKAYTEVDEKKKKKSPIMPDVKGSIDSANHALGGVGDIPGTGIGMVEDVRNDIDDYSGIFLAIQKQFPVAESPTKGASFILPDGKFLGTDRSHSQVDAFVKKNFPDIKLADYPNGYMIDAEQCVRLNDGQGFALTLDRYITLPKYITTEQIDSIEKWLEEYPYNFIKVDDTQGHMVEFNLVDDGLKRIMSRIKKYKNTQILTEDVEETELPDITEDIIEDENAGISSLFIDRINECWGAIDQYHSIIVTLDSLGRHEFDETLTELLESRNKEVGSLQGILESLSPASASIEQGKEEAQEQISFDEVEDEELSLEEALNLAEASDGFTSDTVSRDLEFFRRNPIDYVLYITSRKDFNPFYSKIKGRKDQGKRTNVKAITNSYKYINYCIIAAMLSYDELKDQLLHHPSCYMNDDIVSLMNFVDKKFRYSGYLKNLFEAKRKSYSELNQKKIRLKMNEDWVSNGSLEDFNPEQLINKAMDRKISQSEVRDFDDKLLYINIDPGFVLSSRVGTDTLSVRVIEMDKNSNNGQNNIYEDSAKSPEELANKIRDWAAEYMDKDVESSTEEVDYDSDEGEFINGEEEV